MPKKLLLVESDESYRQLLKLALEKANFEVVATGTSQTAQNLINSSSDFALCISELKTIEIDGIALLKSIARIRPMPVILLSSAIHTSQAPEHPSQAEHPDPREARELGATKILNKPFKKEELISAVQEILQVTPISPEAASAPSPNEGESTDKDDDYCRVNINDFISGKDLQFDIFIRLTAQKYLKIAHQGQSFSPESLNVYKAKNIQYLFMKKEDFKKYVGFSISLSDRVISSPTLPKAKKIQFLKHASEMIATQLHLDGVDEESFDNAKSVMDSTLSVMSDSEELVSMLTMLNANSNTTYSHSIGVSLYATMLAKAIGGGLSSPLVLFKVCMGGMVHDIGKKELPPEILNRPRHLLNPQEMKLYESHPIRGAEILSRIPFVQGEIIQIAGQHHENCLGLGYPANLRMSFIHPLARLVSVANEFCNLAIRGPDTPPLSPLDAIDRMALAQVDTLDPVFFMALVKIFNVQLDPAYHDTQRRNRRPE